MGTKAHGRILVWEGASLWILRAPPNERYPKTDIHAHHVLQVSLALSGRVEFDCDSERIGGEAIAIAPDAPHAFEGTGLVAHLFIASDGKAGREITRALCAKRPFAPIAAGLLGDFPARLRTAFNAPNQSDEDLRALGKDLVARLAGRGSSAQALDPRVTKILAWVAARLDQALSLRDVAALLGLSPGRTRHLFVQQTGLSFRTYVLWLRLERAVELFGAGASLTQAAHGAGFADSAHLSRTFRRMFGISAASLRVS